MEATMVQSATTERPSQRGFVGIVFLAIALIVIVVGAIAAMNRGSGRGTANESDQATASIIIKQGADLKNAYARMLVDPGIQASLITFDSTDTTGLFSQTYKLTPRPLPPAGSLLQSYAGTQYTYNRKVILPSIGSTQRYDFTATLGGLRPEICMAINRQLYHDDVSADPATSSAPLSAWSNTSSETAIDDSGNVAANYVARPEGCITTSDGKYVYYKVLAEDGALTSELAAAQSASQSFDPSANANITG
jgi:hypothetical protein